MNELSLIESLCSMAEAQTDLVRKLSAITEIITGLATRISALETKVAITRLPPVISEMTWGKG